MEQTQRLGAFKSSGIISGLIHARVLGINWGLKKSLF